MKTTIVSADDFRRNAILHTLLYIQNYGGFCKKSQFPKEWNEDILHGALEVLIFGKFIKREHLTYSLIVPEGSLFNKKRVSSPRNVIKRGNHVRS